MQSVAQEMDQVEKEMHQFQVDDGLVTEHGTHGNSAAAAMPGSFAAASNHNSVRHHSRHRHGKRSNTQSAGSAYRPREQKVPASTPASSDESSTGSDDSYAELQSDSAQESGEAIQTGGFQQLPQVPMSPRAAMRAANTAAGRLQRAAKLRGNVAGAPQPPPPLDGESDVSKTAWGWTLPQMSAAAAPPRQPDPDYEDHEGEVSLQMEPAVTKPQRATSTRRVASAVAVRWQKKGPGCEANCNGHGACESGKCRCKHGWVGMTCDMPRCTQDCHGRGLCVQGRCMCHTGWYGDSCAHKRCPDDCSGAGYCFKGMCKCSVGFSGANCALVTPVRQTLVKSLRRAPPLAAAKGVDGFLATATLRQLPPKPCPENCNNRGTCTKEGKCLCWSGYGGVGCQDFCPNECSHQGSCIAGTCLCYAGFLGVDCSVPSCCSGHGSCDEPGKCICNAGWGGKDCAIRLVCPKPDCSGHGTCTHGRCMCKTGFAGSACATSIGSCNPGCSVNGLCNPATNRCVCKAGWTGVDCNEMIQGCKNHCSMKGLCMNGLCMCGAGWQGEDCSVPFFVPGADMPKTDDGGGEGADGGPALAQLLASNSSYAAGDAPAEVPELLPQPSAAGVPDAAQEQPIQTQAPIAGLFEGTEIEGDAELDGRGAAGPEAAGPGGGGGPAAALPAGNAAAGSDGTLGSMDADSVPPTTL